MIEVVEGNKRTQTHTQKNTAYSSFWYRKVNQSESKWIMDYRTTLHKGDNTIRNSTCNVCVLLKRRSDTPLSSVLCKLVGVYCKRSK